VQRGFSLDARTVGPAVEICRRLDGIPLAIELVAARLRMLSVEQIARGLDDALGLVAGGARTRLPRHRTLRGSIDWSYDLLDPVQQRLFQRLGVFVGGFTLPLADAVCIDAEHPAEECLDLLGALVGHSLVQVVDSDGSPRYCLPETVRQYALERLEQSAEIGATRDRHRDAMLALAERQRAAVGGPGMAEALAAIDAEAANALTAIDYAVATSPEKAQRLCVALGPWFRHRGLLREGVRACEAAPAAGPAPSALRARVMTTQAFVLGVQGEFDRSIALAEQAQDLATAIGDEEAALYALLTAANFQMFADPDVAAASLERCLERGLRRQDNWVTARSAMLLATVAWFQQDAERCAAYVLAHRDGSRR
jgi:tetratricopeptide (TPR) repeat protein